MGLWNYKMHTAIVMNKRKVNLSKIVVSNKSYMDPNVVKLKRERERERENGDGRNAVPWGSQDMQL